MRQARSQVGSRLAVASSAKISRPRPPAGWTAGARCRSRRKASTSAERDFSGSRLSSSLIVGPSGGAQPDRGVVEHRAATGEAGIGAGQQVDADPLLERIVWPQPLGNNDTRLHAIESAGMHDDAALRVADSHTLTVDHAERGERLRMDQRGGAALAREARRGVVKAGVQEGARRRGHQAERSLGIVVIDRRDMVREGGQFRMLRTKGGPIGAEMEFLVLRDEAVEEMTGLETGPAIMPDAFLELVRRGQLAGFQRVFEDLERGHLERRV